MRHRTVTVQFRSGSCEAPIVLEFDSKLESSEAGSMKTTLDLPNELVREMKLRAVIEGRKLKDVAAALLAAGLAAKASQAKVPRARRGAIKLPLFPCSPDAPARQMSMAAISAMEQETQTQEDLERLGLPI